MADKFKVLTRDEILTHTPEYKDRVQELEVALRDVLVYAPDYMHGMPKKHYEKIARGDLA
jgi:hypothetical protein